MRKLIPIFSSIICIFAFIGCCVQIQDHDTKNREDTSNTSVNSPTTDVLSSVSPAIIVDEGNGVCQILLPEEVFLESWVMQSDKTRWAMQDNRTTLGLLSKGIEEWKKERNDCRIISVVPISIGFAGSEFRTGLAGSVTGGLLIFYE